MAQYGNLKLRAKKRGHKIYIVICAVVFVIIAILFYIGITVGSGSGEMERMSTAVQENTQLKTQVSELNSEIERLNSEIEGLNAEIADLNAELEARPTALPAPTATPAATSSFYYSSPRSYTYDDDDDDYDYDYDYDDE